MRIRAGLVAAMLALAYACHHAAENRPLDVSEGHGERVFFVLGFLDEYNGRHVVEGDDVVEHFYCNETTKVTRFVHDLEQLAKDQRLKADVRLETVQGCLTLVRSAPLAEALNALYEKRDAPRIEQSWSIDASGRRRRIKTLWSGPALFRGVARRLKLAYVAGAYARYGEGEYLRITNSQHKVALLVALLDELGCTGVHMDSTRRSIPQANTIYFHASPELRDRLERSRQAGGAM